MSTDTLSARDVLNDVRAACEKTGRSVEDAEIERALDGLASEELRAVRNTARQPLSARPLGPQALLDISRGVEPALAAAREISGYYDLRAERDALATIARRGEKAPSAPAPRPAPETAPAPAPAAPAAPRKAPQDDAARAETQRLMTLFAYHRDVVRVAQEMSLGLVELNERIDHLGLRRRINRLLESTTDIDVFSPEGMGVGRTSGTTVPVVRRRTEKTSGEEVLEEASTPSPEPSTPAADTTPRNAHGTRVYRRQEGAPTARETTPAPGLGARREYVREGRRRRATAKPAGPAPRSEPAAPPKAPGKRPFSELQSTAGATILERLLGDEKANPRVLASKLGERYDGPDRPLNESDLRQLIQHHGLADMFREREKANTRFLIGFHQGAKGKLASALQMTPDEVASYLAKLGLTEELEKVRADRARLELGRRKINDRIVQVLTRAPYLDDLGVLQVIDREVRDHLTDQFNARGHSAAEAIRAELGMEKNPFAKLLRRYGLTADAEGSSTST